MKFINQDINIYGRNQKQIQVSSISEFKNTVLKYLNTYISFEKRYPRSDRELENIGLIGDTAQKLMSSDKEFFRYCFKYLIVDNFSEFRNKDTFPGSESIYRSLLQRCKAIDFKDDFEIADINYYQGAPYILVTVGNPKIIIYIYSSGKSLEVYIPIKGNWINYDEGCVIGKHYGLEEEYLKKQGIVDLSTDPNYEESLKEFKQLLIIKDNIDFDYIRKNGLLLFEYIRGSKLYGLDRPGSDEDHGGVYIEPLDTLLGIKKFPEEVNNDTNDDTWFSLGKYSTLLLNSNPNILESLYVPEDKILYKHPLMDLILNDRDKFITKKCFGSFIGYATTQIERARGLKKKITNPIEGPLKSCLEFILYEDNGGSKKIIDFIKDHKMKQEYCGLVGLDKMTCNYCMYYDWGAHFIEELGFRSYIQFKNWVSENAFIPDADIFYNAWIENISKKNINLFNGWSIDYDKLKDYWNTINKPFGYKGLVNMKDTSNQVRLSSIPKGEVAVKVVSYNKDGYSGYCRQWREYNDFEKHHNEERFNLAKEKSFDRKNMTHSARLLNMGIEIAKGEGVKIDRTNIDREFLMNIRLGNTTYEEIMKYLNEKKSEMKIAMDSSTISDSIDLDYLNNIILNIRKKFYEI